MDTETRTMFERSVDAAVDKHTGTALDRALADLGWYDALAADAGEAVSILFERQGARNATSSALDAVLLDGVASRAEGIVLPSLGRWQPPGTVEQGCISIHGLAFGARERVLVVARADDKDVAAVVDRATLTVQPTHGIDPAFELALVTGTITSADAFPVDWSSMASAGQRALAHELIGASRTMLELARTHALERVQFGRPIAMFQAVRHRLAETLVAIETAQAAVDAAWIDGSPVAATMAKALAGRAARVAARHCQQVLAGIGFTTEHDFHRYARRALVLDQLLGSSKALTKDLGDHVLATGQLPPSLPL